MAKRDEYPQNKSMRARIDCLCRSHTNMQQVINLALLMDEEGMYKLPERIRKAFKDATEQADVAGNAMIGEHD